MKFFDKDEKSFHLSFYKNEIKAGDIQTDTLIPVLANVL